MDIIAAQHKLIDKLGANKVKIDEPMSAHTTFKVGGPADLFILPQSCGDVALALHVLNEHLVPLMLMGNGSNMLVRDGGIRGAVMQFGRQFSEISVEGTMLTAQAGALLSSVASQAYSHGLAGMEWASGIPGSVGGASAMNAGAYGGEMKDIVCGVTAITSACALETFSHDDMHFCYRHSRASDGSLTIVEVQLQLVNGDMEKSKALLDEYTACRQQKQPLEFPSAGSFFKRPPGRFAGKLIQDAGLKGARVGGAMVSEKHCGFIVNAGGATASDVLALAALVIESVRQQSGVTLEMEVKAVGEDARMHGRAVHEVCDQPRKDR